MIPNCLTNLQVSNGTKVLFHDCGTLGKHQINVGSNMAVIRFRSGPTSLPHRGFVLYFRGIVASIVIGSRLKYATNNYNIWLYRPFNITHVWPIAVLITLYVLAVNIRTLLQ